MTKNIKIASWNINSIRMRVHHMSNIDVDIICIQEMKCQDEQVPVAQLEEMGFKHNYYRGQKAYNGVGIFSKLPLENVEMLEFGGNEQARHISAQLPNGTRLHNFYIPAGGDEPNVETNPSFAHKLQFVEDMTSYFSLPRSANASQTEARSGLGQSADLDNQHIILGDFNIAPYEHDVWSHKQLLKVVSHTPIEIEKLGNLRDGLGWIDVARKFVPMDEKCYSWWSYRNRDWEKSNRGRRLDHVWVTPELEEKLVSYEVMSHARSWEKPSDHAPILVEISI